MTTTPAAREAGRDYALSVRTVRYRRGLDGTIKRRTTAIRHAIYSGLSSHAGPQLHQDWLAGNARLIVSVEKDLRAFAASVRGFAAVETPQGSTTLLRICALVEAYLDHAHGTFDDELFRWFVAGAQEVCELEMGEIWATKPALQLATVERIVAAATTNRAALPALITSLRVISESLWKETFAALNVIDPVLRRDPIGAYRAMDDDSRDQYRHVVSELAKHSGRSERDVAETAVAMATDACQRGTGNRWSDRRAHVGFYLLDRGLPLLKAHIGYRPPAWQRVADAACRRPSAFYLCGLIAVTAAIVIAARGVLGAAAATVVGTALLLLPATQAAVHLVNDLVSRLIRPRRLPKLDFSDGIPDDCATMVAVPALLLHERHVRELVMDMEIRYLANRDANLSFALVTNSRDSEHRSDDGDAALRLCERLVRELNERYGADGRTPFYLFHRRLFFNPAEDRWMGWERKRGKLLDLNQLLRGVRDRFPVKVGNVRDLSRIRYVITLDSDTELPRDAAHRLVGTIAHPLNRAVIDPATRTVVEGYGILQPRISVSTLSASRSWLASLYSGETGFDIYTRAISDVYQDLFGEGIFTGKGIYEVDAFRESVEQRFPANTLLSHDLIEGLFARAGLVSDIELVDDYPTHFSAYCRRKHRWMRGDWQVLRWLLSRVPDHQRRMVGNPLGIISRWKILDNLRRSLLEPAALILLLCGWFVLPGPAALWTVVLLGMLLLPTYWGVLVAMTQAPWWSPAFRPWMVATSSGFARTHVIIGLHLIYLLHDALLAIDAIVRSLARMFVTRRRLLEWETAAEAALRTRGATDVHLQRSPYIAAVLAAVLWWVRPEALAAASPLLVLWAVSRGVTRWLNTPRRARTSDVPMRDARFLRQHALKTWRFFRTFSTERVHWLIPDYVTETGAAANRITPTNVGFLLNARIAAVHFGYLTLSEFVAETRRTLATIQRLPRHRGHLLNWYDAENLATLEPRFISTVDSGNLAAALWTLREAALQWMHEPPSPDTLWDGISDLAQAIAESDEPGAQTLAERVLKVGAQWRQRLPELEALVQHFASDAEGEAGWWARELLSRLRHARPWCQRGMSTGLKRSLVEIATEAEALVAEMDFAFLYDPRRKVLSVGFDVNTGRLERSTYDLLASEARIASFVAIAKGDIPQESWLHLGRAHVIAHGARVMLSWTGTLFEYLMPALWFRHRPGTIMRQSMRAAVVAQRRFARGRGIPWGFSESGHVRPGADDYGYGACGLPELALKPLAGQAVVVSPYSSFLAMLVDRRAALNNLRRLQQIGCVGTYGFFEAIDFSDGSGRMVASWMAHHQGMILNASAEVLLAHPFQHAFHANPHVRATERLLDERIPRTIVVDVPELPRLLLPEESTA